jgi:predicted transcriptional regulator
VDPSPDASKSVESFLDWYQSGTIQGAMAFTVRPDAQLEEALSILAREEGISRQEVIRRAVLDRYERAGHRARVEQSAERLADRWQAVLDRLHS